MCDYAVKVTVAPSTITRSDIEALRQNGFSDESITIAAQVIGYFNYITRIAEGLGVDDEEGMTPSREEWNRRRGRRYLER